jgi:hypothetical protein
MTTFALWRRVDCSANQAALRRRLLKLLSSRNCLLFETMLAKRALRNFTQATVLSLWLSVAPKVRTTG